jgi:hypothetical protein
MDRRGLRPPPCSPDDGVQRDARKPTAVGGGERALRGGADRRFAPSSRIASSGGASPLRVRRFARCVPVPSRALDRRTRSVGGHAGRPARTGPPSRRRGPSSSASPLGSCATVWPNPERGRCERRAAGSVLAPPGFADAVRSHQPQPKHRLNRRGEAGSREPITQTLHGREPTSEGRRNECRSKNAAS